MSFCQLAGAAFEVTFAFSAKRFENAMVALALRRTPLFGSPAGSENWLERNICDHIKWDVGNAFTVTGHGPSGGVAVG